MKFWSNDNILRKCEYCGKATNISFTIRDGLAQGRYHQDACYQEALKEMQEAELRKAVFFSVWDH